MSTAKHYFQTATAFAFYYSDDADMWKIYMQKQPEVLAAYKTSMEELFVEHFKKGYSDEGLQTLLSISEKCAFIANKDRPRDTATFVVRTLPIGQLKHGAAPLDVENTLKTLHVLQTKYHMATKYITQDQWCLESVTLAQLKKGILLTMDSPITKLLHIYRTVANTIRYLDLCLYIGFSAHFQSLQYAVEQ